MKRISRAAAHRLGRTRYFTGKPCRRHHVVHRLVSNYSCVACANLRSRKYARRDPEKRNAKQRHWKRNNRAAARAWFRKWRRRNYPSVMLASARKRARKRAVPFALTVLDIEIPDRCPVLGCKLRRFGTRGDDRSPTLDRIHPRKGYVRGNVAVISHRANRIKSDATLSELRSLVVWLKKQ